MKVFLIFISPLDVFLWTVRRNEKDVVNLYDKLSPIMQLATGGSMLNFGLWDETIKDPLSAQRKMCSYISQLSELDSANLIADVGSGLSEPAQIWKKENPGMSIFCVNSNFKQLCFTKTSEVRKINSTATCLPFTTNSLDRIIALESAQHFKPLESFFNEAKRVLKKHGILTLTMPITMKKYVSKKLGILNFTWSSEHYFEKTVMDIVTNSGFQICSKKYVGKDVYEPLVNYYIENRNTVKKNILQKYPSFVESVLFKSMIKMKETSQKNIINYLILKAKTKS